MNIGRGNVKSVLAEFSYGVSICRKKDTQSDLGPPFLPAPTPGLGVRGGLAPALVLLLIA